MTTSFPPYPFISFDRASVRPPIDPEDAAARRPLLVDLAARGAEAAAEPRAPDDLLQSEDDAVPYDGSGEPARFSEAELEAAVREAEHRVRSAVEQASQARIDCRLAAAVERLADRLADVRDAEATAAAARAAADAGLAVAVARAIVPHALMRAPLADVEAMLVELLQGLEREPRLELRLAPDLVEAGRRLIHEVAERVGWSGAVEVGADESLGEGDARLAWAEGRAERQLERVVAEVEEMLSSVFAEQTSDDRRPGPPPAADPVAGGEPDER